MTLDELLAMIKERCDAAGSQKTWAEANGLSQAYVSDVLNGRRDPGKKLLGALGLIEVKRFDPAI